jgi:lipopolysaccharide export system protein LptA
VRDARTRRFFYVPASWNGSVLCENGLQVSCRFAQPVSSPFLSPLARAALLLALTGLTLGAHAEKGDRDKPVNIEADDDGSVDLLKQVVVFKGNVVITQGTMTIRAARVEVRQTPEGFRAATAFGGGSRPASFRQKRDGVDEYIEGLAERIEYDGTADVVRFLDNATVRRLRGGSVADETTGNLITYDNVAETFSVTRKPAPSPSNPSGRVRAVLTPAPAEAPASAPPPGAPKLKPSGSLGEQR